MHVGKRRFFGWRAKRRAIPAAVTAVCLLVLALIPVANAAINSATASGPSMKVTLIDSDTIVVTLHDFVAGATVTFVVSGDQAGTGTGVINDDGRYYQAFRLPTDSWSGTLDIAATSGTAKTTAHVVVKNGVITSTGNVTTTTAAPAATTSTTMLMPTTTLTTLDDSSETTVTTKAPVTTVTTKAPVAAAGNPLAGVTFTGINKNAANQAAAWKTSNPADAALMTKMANVPTAQWGNSTDALDSAGGKVPVLVVYNLPGRDCGQFSSGGAGSEAEYNAFIDKYAASIGQRKAVVILEPDTLSQMCGDTAARFRMLNHAVDALAKTGAITYLDAGNPGWVDAATIADRLKQAGVAKARGFAVNVSNFKTNADNIAYGDTIAKALNSHYVVDTSRNGNGPGTDWCNPPGRALGLLPTTKTASTYADAYLWIKIPGESDGNCNGAPGAGQWYPSYALGLAQRAKWQ
jgi:endoglucanase